MMRANGDEAGLPVGIEGSELEGRATQGTARGTVDDTSPSGCASKLVAGRQGSAPCVRTDPLRHVRREWNVGSI